ncbi:arrestin domain-containing protein 17 [Eurytemora carolleeae]|uniref:arrestin domain-containing protein 17 n=1 Tax=Eurytemora carolleeae TaxID=1294199 RepID=UPI000C75F9FC|nr:arrestin domain-containing protein 17 [Eurytemora carolleeae]|eukprot:XP_023343512.1 arrestin domain-containing protein 17-like [Eurytemora affinis]
MKRKYHEHSFQITNESKMSDFEFEIEFLNPSNTFQGEVLEGKIIISLDEPMTMSRVTIAFHGNASVSWVEGTGKEKQRRKDEETLLKEEITVFNGPELGIGLHDLPFTFPLPTDLPSSFEGSNGSILYYAEAVIVRSWRRDPSVREGFTVNARLDLNKVLDCKLPGEARDSKMFCCLWCKSGPLSAFITTDRQCL